MQFEWNDEIYEENKGDGRCTECDLKDDRNACRKAYEINDCQGSNWKRILIVKQPIQSEEPGVKLDSQEEFDVVSKPKHYMLVPGVEVRDICKALADRMQGKYPAFFISDYVQFLQYVLRFDQKNGVEDLKKAQWYLDKLVNDQEVKE